MLVPASIGEVEVKELVLARQRVKVYTDDKKILNIIYVPRRVMNIVVE